MQNIAATAHLPGRHEYAPGDEVPEGVKLAKTVGPWWTVTAADETWNHVAVMHSVWNAERGGWDAIPNGQADLIVTSHSLGERHPTLDRTRHADAETAMRAAWDAGLLGLIVFPMRRP